MVLLRLLLLEKPPGTYFNCIMFMVASSVVSTILILNYHHRNPDTHEMSDWVRKRGEGVQDTDKRAINRACALSANTITGANRIPYLVALSPEDEPPGRGNRADLLGRRRQQQ